jgi:putative nucleotidyltransferase with HDIG domain
LSLHDELVGVIELVDAPSGLELTGRQQGLLSAICLIGTTALEICNLFTEQEERWTGLIEALCDVVETEKSYKRDHAVRVSAVSTEIARALGQTDEDELRLLRTAGLVHDIGETRIPKRIREKKGRLRDNEWGQIRRHSRISADMIEGASRMGRLVKIVLHHHEHFDGNGYPDGLVGEQIPLESRIIAVADAYVAMTSDRPYRPKLPDDTAVQRILAASSTQFDPVVVNAFMQYYSARAIAEDQGQRLTHVCHLDGGS